MDALRQGVAAIAFVASLGLVTSASLAGPASADVSSDGSKSPQPMSIECDLDGKSANGFEYESEVNSVDMGDELGTMRDRNSARQFVAVSGYVYSIYTAIEDRTRFPQDDSSPYAVKPLDAGDPRLAGGYPVSFEIPRGYPFSVFGDGFKTKAAKKKNGPFVDCIATDLGVLRGAEAKDVLGSTQCRRDGVLQDDCYQNLWSDGASKDDVKNSRPCVAFGDEDYGKCMALGVTYHYQDEYHVKVRVMSRQQK